MGKVCVVGLGYVGLPLLCLSLSKGHDVVGFDIDEEKIDLLSGGESYIEELEESVKSVADKIKVSINPNIISRSDIVIVCVPTPVDDDKNPDLEPLKSACEMISKNLNKDKLVIVESTVAPGTIDGIVKPILEASGLVAGKDFLLAFCPERIDPGSVKWPLSKIPRVVGAVSQESLGKAVRFYESILDAGVLPLSSIMAAEASKILENSFRDVNIAFVNEIAMSFDKFGLDVSEVIRAASTKPFGFMPFYPGAGVGGHCIPVDPYYLIKEAERQGFDHRFLKLAREINNGMPVYVVDLLEGMMSKYGKGSVCVLGLAFKGDIDDTRMSPSFKVISELGKRGVDFVTYDPFVGDSTVDSLSDGLKASDYVLLVTDHSEFKDISPKTFQDNNIKGVVDGRNCLDKEGIRDLGIVYKGVGR